jgi:hypothetical protein
MREPIASRWGLLICAVLIIIFGLRPESASGAEGAKQEPGEATSAWKEIRKDVWLKQLKGIDGIVTLTYARYMEKDWFGVTIPCGTLPRTYSVVWERGDEVGVTRVSCTGQQNVMRPVYHLEELFTDLPNGAPPARPAEVFMEDYAYYA